MSVAYGSLPFKQQIAYLRQKHNVPTERWADLWKHAHDRGFMVAGAMKTDLLADFRSAVDKAISEGKSLNWFKQAFNDIADKHGWQYNGHPSWRAQVIYETNLRQSYTAGREQQMQATKATRPYAIYKHSGSEHPRHEHLSWHNLVLPIDDPWWKTHTPTNGYGCGCKKFSLSERDLERKGLKVSPSPTVEYYEWVDKVTGEAHQIPKGIDPGFDYVPTSSEALTKQTQALVAQKPPLAERLPERAVPSAFSTVSRISAETMSQLLSQLKSAEVAAFTDILKQHSLKTLILKQSELSGGVKARAIAEPIAQYLNKAQPYAGYYRSRRPTRVNGFTNASWDHVIVKAKSTDSLNKVTVEQLQAACDKVFELFAMKKPTWSFSTEGAVFDSGARVFITWIHEMGHQVYFKAGQPPIADSLRASALTVYSKTNHHEWFAEHFIAWLLQPERLKREYPRAFDFIQSAVEKARYTKE
ncbi:phage minor head protein [Vibrio cholerae]|uniref:phage minor head protein n=1 Tax=Vibrio cholerae TaxID=666 RepID=UPI00115B1E39|nr:phage minor head protein [Vibrio cholerae]EGR1044255.1 F protein [Vibrio cholerae]ELJ8687136.1 F protein [Vibrio cholerae]TQQ56821.1 F protein [Vibrio cholerae]HDZ9323792.1 F protein [Vibrio cholerae]